MILLELDFTLPLKNPVIIFSLVLFIILFVPILLNKIRIPHIMGLILAGVIVGPYGLNLLLRDSSIVLFGTVGLLYIMFLAGLEIDLAEVKKNTGKIAFFGLSTFLIPFTVATGAAYYVLGYSWMSSILLASMFSTHTLVGYPIASRYGLTSQRSVTLTVGGTIITDTLALLVLAVIAGMAKGDIGPAFWVQLSISTLIFVLIVVLLFPIVTKWFFKKSGDNVSQYIFVLGLVFLAAFLAEAAGVEAIIGAFLAGLAINRLIPRSSPLMNRIDFVGNALFIPFFLIGVGMLVDIKVLFMGWGALKVAGVIIVVAVVTKYVAAWVTQKSFNLSKIERSMIFGLSNSHAAATLAIILVGYNIVIGETPAGEPIRLLNEDVLNGTILLILISCTISSFVVEKASRQLALEAGANQEELPASGRRILLPLAYPDTLMDLVDLALIMQKKKQREPLYALHVVDEQDKFSNDAGVGKKMLEQVVKHAAAADAKIVPITRFDMNISNGIIYTIKEHAITDVIIGLHRQPSSHEDFFGTVAERVLRRSPETIYVYKAAQPLSTLNRIVVAVPQNAEYEPGFHNWFNVLETISRQAGLQLVIYAGEQTIHQMKQINENRQAPAQINFEYFTEWAEFLIFTREIRKDDLFVIVSSRKGYDSYQAEFEKLPVYLSKYFQHISFVLLYPEQLEHGLEQNMENMEASLINPIPDNLNILNKAGKIVKRIFTEKKD